MTATGGADRVRPDRRADPGHRSTRHPAHPRTAPARTHHRHDRRGHRSGVLRAHAAARHAAIRRFRVRDRHHRRTGPGGAVADRDAVVGHRRTTNGEPSTLSCDAWSRSRRSARPRSSAPTRPARSPRTGCASSRSGRRRPRPSLRHRLRTRRGIVAAGTPEPTSAELTAAHRPALPSWRAGAHTAGRSMTRAATGVPTGDPMEAAIDSLLRGS